jgi:hypothetical protein
LRKPLIEAVMELNRVISEELGDEATRLRALLRRLGDRPGTHTVA